MAERDQQTEKPTPRRLQKARAEGNFPVSREFVNGVQFLAFVSILVFFGPQWLSNLAITSRLVIDRGFHTDVTPTALRELLYLIATRQAYPVALAGAALVGVGLATHLAVTRMGLSFQK